MNTVRQTSGGVLALLLLVDDSFGRLFAQAVERLLLGVSVHVTQAAHLESALAANRPRVVFHAVPQPSLGSSHGSNSFLNNQCPQADLLSRAAGAMYLPTTLWPDRMVIGPLVGPGRSCMRCWIERRLQNASHASATRTTRQMPSQPAILVNVAVAATVSLLNRDPHHFVSPYVMYMQSSGHLKHGSLTSRHECDLCRGHLRTLYSRDAELSALALGLARPAAAQGRAK